VRSRPGGTDANTYAATACRDAGPAADACATDTRAAGSSDAGPSRADARPGCADARPTATGRQARCRPRDNTPNRRDGGVHDVPPGWRSGSGRAGWHRDAG
jgi:hypothetical protein